MVSCREQGAIKGPQAQTSNLQFPPTPHTLREGTPLTHIHTHQGKISNKMRHQIGAGGGGGSAWFQGSSLSPPIVERGN